MANRERGEIEIVVEGRPYTWRLTINAACALEARTGQKLGEVLMAADGGGMLALRDVVWILLQDYHAEEFPTVEDVGHWIDRAGMLTCAAKFRELLEANAPRAGGAAADPRGAPDPSGTGANSGSIRAVSV